MAKSTGGRTGSRLAKKLGRKKDTITGSASRGMSSSRGGSPYSSQVSTGGRSGATKAAAPKPAANKTEQSVGLQYGVTTTHYPDFSIGGRTKSKSGVSVDLSVGGRTKTKNIQPAGTGGYGRDIGSMNTSKATTARTAKAASPKANKASTPAPVVDKSMPKGYEYVGQAGGAPVYKKPSSKKKKKKSTDSTYGFNIDTLYDAT